LVEIKGQASENIFLKKAWRNPTKGICETVKGINYFLMFKIHVLRLLKCDNSDPTTTPMNC